MPMKTKSTDTKKIDEIKEKLLGAEAGGRKIYSPKRMAASIKGGRLRGAGQLMRVIVPALLLVVIAVAVTMIARRSTEYRFDGAAGQYYGGQKFSIPEGTRMYRRGTGATKLSGGTLKRETDALPAYYENRQAVVLPQDMVYYAPRDNTCLRVEHFSELTYNSLGVQEISLKRKTADMQAGFLYDGKDIYLFLEPVKLSVNGAVIDLGAMSCVEADTQIGMISVYNTNGEMLFEEMKSRCSVYPASKDYTVYLLDDSMERHDGTRVLLFGEPQKLDPLF